MHFQQHCERRLEAQRGMNVVLDYTTGIIKTIILGKTDMNRGDLPREKAGKNVEVAEVAMGVIVPEPIKSTRIRNGEELEEGAIVDETNLLPYDILCGRGKLDHERSVLNSRN